jgi:hypothetical protein
VATQGDGFVVSHRSKCRGNALPKDRVIWIGSLPVRTQAAACTVPSHQPPSSKAGPCPERHAAPVTRNLVIMSRERPRKLRRYYVGPTVNWRPARSRRPPRTPHYQAVPCFFAVRVMAAPSFNSASPEHFLEYRSHRPGLLPHQRALEARHCNSDPLNPRFTQRTEIGFRLRRVV